MKEIIAFALVLVAIFGTIVMVRSPDIPLNVAQKPASKGAGASGPLPENAPTPIPLSPHIWPPALGTSYENRRLEGIARRFDVTEPQIFLVFAYRDMTDGLSLAITVSREGGSKDDMNWLWDANRRPAKGTVAVDILTVILDLQPGKYSVEISVDDKTEQRIEFELFEHKTEPSSIPAQPPARMGVSAQPA